MLGDYRMFINVFHVLKDNIVIEMASLTHLDPALQVIIALRVVVFQCLRIITVHLVYIALGALLVHWSVLLAIIPTQVE